MMTEFKSHTSNKRCGFLSTFQIVLQIQIADVQSAPLCFDSPLTLSSQTLCQESAKSSGPQASVGETGRERNLGGNWGCICVCMSLGEGLLLRDGDIFWSLNGQSVPTETGSNVRSAMEWPPSCSLSSSFVRVHVCVAQKLNPFYPNPIWNIRIHWVWFIWRYDFFTDILFQMAPVLWLWWAGLWLSMSYRADMLMGL